MNDSWPTLKIGKHVSRYPLIQGGMGVMISGPRLAGAVARAGGVGTIASVGLACASPHYNGRNYFEANQLALKDALAEARAAAPQGILAVNCMVALTDYDRHVHAACEGGVDVIILARGGGSLEDLAPFNDEGVARAIARSRIPVISAVGHETDFTIADFTADLRAATPSAAAELVVPLRRELRDTVETLRLRLVRNLETSFTRLRERVAGLQSRLRDPKRRLADARIALDDNVERMRLSVIRMQEGRRQAWIHLNLRLTHRDPRSRIGEERVGLEGLRRSLRASWVTQSGSNRTRLQTAAALLSSLSPLAVLGRGYSIVRRRPDGLILRRAGDVAAGQEIDVRLAAGSLRARIMKILEEPSHVQGEI